MESHGSEEQIQKGQDEESQTQERINSTTSSAQNDPTAPYEAQNFENFLPPQAVVPMVQVKILSYLKSRNENKILLSIPDSRK